MKKNIIKAISILMVLVTILTFGACKDNNQYEQSGNV